MRSTSSLTIILLCFFAKLIAVFLALVAIRFNDHRAYIRLLVFALLFTLLAYIMHRHEGKDCTHFLNHFW